jgi:hypothetical protein
LINIQSIDLNKLLLILDIGDLSDKLLSELLPALEQGPTIPKIGDPLGQKPKEGIDANIVLEFEAINQDTPPLDKPLIEDPPDFLHQPKLQPFNTL